MFWTRNETSRSRFGEEPVVIGLFPYASDARRALHVLHEHHFATEQVAAAFREPSAGRQGAPDVTLPASGSGKWFGQLRQIYRGSDDDLRRRELDTESPAPGANQIGFEAMLAKVELSEEDARIFQRELDQGAALVTVRAGARNAEAQALLEQRGAHILHNRSHPSNSAIEPNNSTVIHSTPFVSPQTEKPDHIQLFGEVLRIHKEKVSSGEVHVRKETTTRLESVQVPVTREHLVVEHTDGSGKVNPDHTLRVPLSEERVHIDKDTVLREEYKVGKREVTQNELVSDTVRRERLLVDDASAGTKA